MASIEKRPTGWRVKVRMRGVVKSATFQTKAQAVQWAGEIEHKIRRGELAQAHDRTLRDVLDEYAEKVSPAKKGTKWEQTRLAYYGKDEIAATKLADLTPAHFARLRDRRLKEVTAATLNRDLVLLSHALKTAWKEWGWLAGNPLTDVRRPKEAGPRSRRLMAGEMEALRIAMGYRPDRTPATAMARVAACFEFALETALRSGEIVTLRWKDVHADHVHVQPAKTDKARDVPLSARAKEIVGQLRPLQLDPVFGLAASQRDALWRKGCAKAGVTGLHFHDSRREALTRLAAIYQVMDLAKISGHQDIALLQSVYYAPTVAELAAKMHGRAR